MKPEAPVIRIFICLFGKKMFLGKSERSEVIVDGLQESLGGLLPLGRRVGGRAHDTHRLGQYIDDTDARGVLIVDAFAPGVYSRGASISGTQHVATEAEFAMRQSELAEEGGNEVRLIAEGGQPCVALSRLLLSG